MSKKRAKGILYPILLVVAWGVMGYSVLFGGFSTSLADYGSGSWDCPYPSGCASLGCSSTIQNPNVAYCSTYSVQQGVSCPNQLSCNKIR